MTGALVDTNVLVYAYSESGTDPRNRTAKTVLSERSLLGDGFASVQNLAELSSVCLTKIRPPLPAATMRQVVADLERILTVLRPSADTVKSALSAVERHRLSFWDAMLWAVAKENGVGEIISEDFQDGQEIEGIRFQNPFK